LEMKLDLEVAVNKKLNKLAWCYLTLMLQGAALDEMDMIPEKNAHAIWLHLNKKYKPRNEIKSEKEREACTVCDQKRQTNQGEEQCLENQEEKGSYCCINLWKEDIEEVREGFEKKDCEGEESQVGDKEETANREKNEEAEKGEQEFKKDLLKENDDDPIREEDTEEEKAKEFPIKTRVNEDEEINEEDVDKIQEHETTEMKEEKEELEEEERVIKNEKDECLTCEDQSQQKESRVKDKCLVGDEDEEKKGVKSQEKCLNGEEESLKNVEKDLIGKKETNEDLEEEKCPIEEEEIVFWIDMEEVQEKQDDFWNEEYWLWEEHWQEDWQEDVKKEEIFLFWKEYWNEKENKEEAVKSDESLVRKDKETRKEVENEEKSLIGEEDIHVEKAEDVFEMYQEDEEPKEFIKENKVQDNQKKEKELKKEKLEKYIVFKVVREAVSRVKEKPD